MLFRDQLTGRQLLEPTDVNIKAAKAFVFTKWRERAAELGRPVPADLSSSCRFNAHFSQIVFGGKVCGNWFHQWCELDDGTILDLSEGAQDVAHLLRGEVPPEVKTYAEGREPPAPGNLYTHDQEHMDDCFTQDGNKSVARRVESWALKFFEGHRPLMRVDGGADDGVADGRKVTGSSKSDARGARPRRS